MGQYGWGVVRAYMRHVMNNAEESVRRVIDRIGGGSFTYTMDNGLPSPGHGVGGSRRTHGNG